MIVDVKKRFDYMRNSHRKDINELDITEKFVQTLPFESLPEGWSVDIYVNSVEFRFDQRHSYTSEEFINRLKRLRKEMKVFTSSPLELHNIMHLYGDTWAVEYRVDLSTDYQKYYGDCTFYIDEETLKNSGLLKKGCSIHKREPSKDIVCSKEK